MTEAPNTAAFARPRVAAGALFTDEAGRVLLVRPTYKPHWDIPGGYVEPGESPRTACIREVHEELTLSIQAGEHLVTDWAPALGEGDKLLFIFDFGILGKEAASKIILGENELSEWRFVKPSEFAEYVPDRLARRILIAIAARERGSSAYAEHGYSV
ncbi:NUDIX hydrolase [Luedemannella flava]|uniref:NUDIX hydrolase n=1 Tax=Luedemannella flava TaxID=349316 RepID=A0ABP4YDZ3_9ACTN